MGRKRKGGEGTVRLRGDGRWEGRVVIGYDEKNYPKTKSVLAKTKSECIEKLKELKEKLGPTKSEKIHPGMPFGDWMDFWYQNYSKPKLRATTRNGYEGRIYGHIIPELGSIATKRFTRFSKAKSESMRIFSFSDIATAFGSRIISSINVPHFGKYSHAALV